MSGAGARAERAAGEAGRRAGAGGARARLGTAGTVARRRGIRKWGDLRPSPPAKEEQHQLHPARTRFVTPCVGFWSLFPSPGRVFPPTDRIRRRGRSRPTRGGERFRRKGRNINPQSLGAPGESRLVRADKNFPRSLALCSLQTSPAPAPPSTPRSRHLVTTTTRPPHSLSSTHPPSPASPPPPALSHGRVPREGSCCDV